jgi:hypothetical protein
MAHETLGKLPESAVVARLHQPPQLSPSEPAWWAGYAEKRGGEKFMEIKKPTIKKGWTLFKSPSDRMGLYYPEGWKGFSFKGLPPRPLNGFALAHLVPDFASLPVGSIFELEGRETIQRVSPKGRVLETRFGVHVHHKFVVDMDVNTGVAGYIPVPVAWRIVP